MMCLLGTTGCWDSSELNDVAFIIGTGLDKISTTTFSVSAQMADPRDASGSDGKASDSKGYIVETADGVDLSAALGNLQNQLPRTVITGHRQAIVVGEQLARSGIGTCLDEVVRNNRNSLRTDLFIIKGGTAKQFLQNKYAFETFSALAAGKQQNLLSTYETTLRDFLYNEMSEATSCTLPVIETYASEDEDHASPSFSLNGTALFNRNLQLVGYLNQEQSFLYLWGVNKLQHLTLTEPIDPSGNLISLDMNHLHSKIRIRSYKGQRIAQITLSGKGRIIENHTKFNPSQLTDIEVIQQRLNQQVAKNMHSLIVDTQDKYQTDIFRFGEEFHQTYPSEWKRVRTNWPRNFPELKIEVSTRLTVLHGGELKTGDIFAG